MTTKAVIVKATGKLALPHLCLLMQKEGTIFQRILGYKEKENEKYQYSSAHFSFASSKIKITVWAKFYSKDLS